MKKEQHSELIELITELFKMFEKLPTSMERTDIIYLEQGEYITWINYQINTLDDSFNLLHNNSYKSSFTLIRSAYESYWVILLAMLGDRYYIKYIPKEGSNIQKIHQQYVRDFEENKKEREEQGIIKIHNIKNNSFKIEYFGRKNQEGEIIPHYYFLFNEYNPEIAYLGFEEGYYESDKLSEIQDEMENRHKDLNYYFRFEKGIKENLILNNLVTEKDFEKMLVHYSFLSTWTHFSKQSIDIIEGNTYRIEDYKQINTKYNFYLTRLSLLYIGNLLSMYLKLWIKFGKKQISEKKLKDLKFVEEFEDLINKFEEKIDYFWFIFNKPSAYFKWEYCCKQLCKNIKSADKLKLIDYNLIEDRLIPYYKNPLKSLKEMSHNRHNRVVGYYRSPLIDDINREGT